MSDKIDLNEVTLAQESTKLLSLGADSETSYTDSVDFQITLPTSSLFRSHCVIGIPSPTNIFSQTQLASMYQANLSLLRSMGKACALPYAISLLQV